MTNASIAPDPGRPSLTAPSRFMSRLSWAGLVFALLALVAAALSPWAVRILDGPGQPIDERAVEIAGRIKDRVAARVKGETYIPPARPAEFRWSKWYPALVVAVGALAVCIGVVGFVRRGDSRLNGATIAVGSAAVVFQYALIIAALLLLLLLVGLVLMAFGGF